MDKYYIRRKKLLYLRDSVSLPSNTLDYKLIDWTPPNYSEVIDDQEFLTKIEITHIGNVAYTNVFYEIIYGGDRWELDFQLGTVNIPLELASPLEIINDKIQVFVSNKDTVTHIPEITIMGRYEKERIDSLLKQRAKTMR